MSQLPNHSEFVKYLNCSMCGSIHHNKLKCKTNVDASPDLPFLFLGTGWWLKTENTVVCMVIYILVSWEAVASTGCSVVEVAMENSSLISLQGLIISFSGTEMLVFSHRRWPSWNGSLDLGWNEYPGGNITDAKLYLLWTPTFLGSVWTFY